MRYQGPALLRKYWQQRSKHPTNEMCRNEKNIIDYRRLRLGFGRFDGGTQTYGFAFAAFL